MKKPNNGLKQANRKWRHEKRRAEKRRMEKQHAVEKKRRQKYTESL